MGGKTLVSPWRLSSLLLDEKTSDVTFQCDNESVKAHRCILAAQSKVFENMLYGEGNCEKNAVTLNSDSKTFKSYLGYLYGSTLTVNDENFGSLYKLASLYETAHLVDHLDGICKQFIGESSFATVWEVYDMGTETLQTALLKHIAHNFDRYSKNGVVDSLSKKRQRALIDCMSETLSLCRKWW
eukprot:Filipodium_phascolosomae@DN1993_c0_g1_i2.p1